MGEGIDTKGKTGKDADPLNQGGPTQNVEQKPVAPFGEDAEVTDASRVFVKIAQGELSEKKLITIKERLLKIFQKGNK